MIPTQEFQPVYNQVISEGSSSEYTSNHHNIGNISSSPSTYVYLGSGPQSPKTVKIEKIDMKT